MRFYSNAEIRRWHEPLMAAASKGAFLMSKRTILLTERELFILKALVSYGYSNVPDINAAFAVDPDEQEQPDAIEVGDEQGPELEALELDLLNQALQKV